MSRIGKAPISIPQGVTITIKENIVTVKGKLGELTQVVKDVAVKQEDGQLIVERQLDTKQGNALHGLYRALLHNMVVGVSEGFTKELELVGVGYRATNQGQKLDLALGFSHNILMELPQEIKVETINEKSCFWKVIKLVIKLPCNTFAANSVDIELSTMSGVKPVSMMVSRFMPSATSLSGAGISEVVFVTS